MTTPDPHHPPQTTPELMVLGSAVVDRIETADRVTELAGGAALNAAVGARRLGLDVGLIAVIQDDDPGHLLRGFLDSEGVVLGPPTGTDRPTAVVTSRRADDTVSYRFNTPEPSGTLALNCSHYEQVRTARGVVLSAARFATAQAARDIVEALGEVRGPRLYDPNPRMRGGADIEAHRAEIDRIAESVDLVKFALEDIDLLYGEDPEVVRARFLSRGVRAILTTDGERGARITTAAGGVHVPSRIAPADVVNPMGAGDATLAAVAAWVLRRGWPLDEDEWQATIDFAMATAALACRGAGAATSMPDIAAVLAALGAAE